jgi:mevalonate kinase
MSDCIARVSAPGKLFLVGEYAVLDGAPALLTAVDRRVTVTLTTADGPSWILRAPGLGSGVFRLSADGSVPDTADTSTREHLRVFDAVRAECTARFGAPTVPLEIEIDSRDFSAAGYKLGLGSSAAVPSTG